MSGHVFHAISLHLNWHVKDDRPTLNPDVEPIAHRLLEDRCRRTTGVYLHEIGGTATHVHRAIIREGGRRADWSESRRMRMARKQMSEDSTRSPAEAGWCSTVGPAPHQLKLVANRESAEAD